MAHFVIGPLGGTEVHYRTGPAILLLNGIHRAVAGGGGHAICICSAATRPFAPVTINCPDKW